MTDYEDYENNLAFPPTTDSTSELVEKIEKLSKQLEIAFKALEDYAESDNWELENEKYIYWALKGLPYPWRIAGKALKQIKELDK